MLVIGAGGQMSWLSARLYDRFMRSTEQACLRPWRRALLADLAGVVLEVGAGTGATLELYPPAVTRLVLCEPDPHMRQLLVARAPHHAEVSSARAEKLPFDAASFDTVVASLVLCSVVDQARALGEIARVLKPGAPFVFLEHVAAEEHSARLAWQHRVEPVWRRVMDNCHLTRRTEAAITAAGLELEVIERESMRKALPIVRPTIRGVARKPIRSGR